MTCFVEVSGPDSLAALVTALAGDPAAVAGDVASLPAPDGVTVVAQFDEVDADTWPYLISVDADSGAEAEVRAIAERLRPTGWAFRAFVDDDQLVAESPSFATA
ncbi:scaffolding protein [Mycobacterium phage MalagasyRose]|uniref:Scaffolding protein n=1 Tax=Mycobacterium phage MalagasyRose TaxID=2599870 RepID=A0A5J6TDH0_9CAUD|nr:scaffolding protein [Mycobacterium phage MalagasyRose]QFG08860.1 scaffolding protein [Mycobacterium phage MalagasyRose]